MTSQRSRRREEADPHPGRDALPRARNISPNRPPTHRVPHPQTIDQPIPTPCRRRRKETLTSFFPAALLPPKRSETPNVVSYKSPVPNPARKFASHYSAPIILPLLLLLLLVSRAPAADLPREFEVTPTLSTNPPPFLTQVHVPDALCAAVNDTASLLVIGHKSPSNQHLAVFRLDATGRPGTNPTWLTLPKPAVLATNANYPLGLLFHPRLPLLYVWQDINGPPADKQEKHPAFTNHLEFDHLLIYAIKNGALELIETAAHGPNFHVGLLGGTIGLDHTATTLFVPNSLGGTWDEAGIGYYALDDQGLPQDPDKATVQTRAKPPARATLPTSKAARTLAAVQRKRTHRYYPSGAGWFAGSQAMIMGGYSGCMIADFNQGSLRQSWFNLPDHLGNCFIAGHPQLPAIYLALQNSPRLFQIAHADGFVSLLPQVATVTNAHFLGTPVVLPKLARVAVGGVRSLHLFGLQPDGRLDGRVEQIVLPCAAIKGFAWSEKYTRLYVAVDKPN